MGIPLIDNGRDDGQFPTMDSWRKKLADEIERRGLDMKRLSQDAGLGETYVRDAIKRGRGKFENLFKVVALLGYPPEWLTSEAEIEPQPKRRPDSFRPQITPGAELVTREALPIYAAAQGGDGHIIVTFDAVQHVKMPAILEGVKGAYGILVTGDSMDPEFRPGDMALINPHLHPMRDETHVFYDHPPDGEAEAIVKRLLSWTADVWRLRQFNPPLDFEEAKVDWPTCHRVVGKYNRR